MNDPKARRKAELELAVLEDELVEAKASASPAKLRKVKDKVREARAAFRADRDEASGAAPATVKTTVKKG